MVDNLTRFRSQNARVVRHEARPEADEDGYQAFSFGRVGPRPQMTLLFRKANGEVRGFPYAQFDGIESDNPDDGFVVKFGRTLISIEGRNLNRLFQYVCNYKAAEIVEASPRVAVQLCATQPNVWRVIVTN